MLLHSREALGTNSFTGYVQIVESQILRVNGESFHTLRWGSTGPLVHLAHANGFCAKAYAPFGQWLSGRFRVVATDLRGHGETRATAEPKQLRNWNVFVRDMGGLFEALGGEIIAIGHSLGAVVSLLATVERPELVRGLVLIDPVILPPAWAAPMALAKKLGLGERFPLAKRARKRRRTWPSREQLYDTYKKKKTFRTWRHEFFDNCMSCSLRETAKGFELACDPKWESQIFATVPHDLWDVLPRVSCPMMVLYGGQSDVFRRDAVDEIQRMRPATTVHGWPEATHFLPMEFPEEVVARIEAFFDVT